jgi:serine/threonine protein kinase
VLKISRKALDEKLLQTYHEQFNREITSFKEVQKYGCHPFIIRFHEAFYIDDRVCIILEYAKGGDLHKTIRSKPKPHDE